MITSLIDLIVRRYPFSVSVDREWHFKRTAQFASRINRFNGACELVRSTFDLKITGSAHAFFWQLTVSVAQNFHCERKVNNPRVSFEEIHLSKLNFSFPIHRHVLKKILRILMITFRRCGCLGGVNNQYNWSVRSVVRGRYRSILWLRFGTSTLAKAKVS